MAMELSREASRARPVHSDSIPSHLRCNGCSQLLVNSSQTAHGCRLCQRCVDTHRLCPCARGDSRNEDRLERTNRVTSFKCAPDLGTRREVLKLTVHCPNMELGCRKLLPWKQVDSHLDNECDFNNVKCDLCLKMVPKFKLKDDGSHRNLQSADCCREHRGPCPLCGDFNRMLNRQEFVEHLNTCPERPTDCKYRESVGCPAKPSLSQLDMHYNSGTDGHIELILNWFQKELENLARCFEQMNELKQAELQQLRQDVNKLMTVQELTCLELRALRQGTKDLQTRLDPKDAEIRNLKLLLSQFRTGDSLNTSQQGAKDLKPTRPTESARSRRVKKRRSCRTGSNTNRKRLR